MSSPQTRSSTKGYSFRCKACSRAFSKAEHLQRHERTHSGAKPFVCTACGRQFARSDSLARHLRTHVKERQPNQQLSSPAGTPQSTAVTTYNDGQLSFLGQVDQQASRVRDNSNVANGGADHDCPFDSSMGEFDVSLQWPDAEELLHMIVSSDWNSLALPPGVSFSVPEGETAVASSTVGPCSQDHHSDMDLRHQAPPTGSSYMAIHSLSHMITNLSSRVTSAVKTLPDLTPTFLDTCLQNYFSCFNTYFPVLHQPTFMFRECSPSLLLNAIALGSLFVGTQEAISKGEALWRLAYTAVATSWQHLMSHKGIYDSSCGVQLALTALLGQSYAMLSKNESLRVTSQIYHILGFNWARHCNMFDPQVYALSDLPSLSRDNHTTETSWRRWIARELQLRALLGHYILLGQIDRLSGHTSIGVHTSNPLVLSTDLELFDKQTADDWIEAIESSKSRAGDTFRGVYAELFELEHSPEFRSAHALENLNSALDIRVVLECLHCLVIEIQSSETQPHSIISFPSKPRAQMAFLKLYDHLQSRWSDRPVERLELIIQWHFACLGSVVNPLELCSELCQYFEIKQLFPQTRKRGSQDSEPAALNWARSSADAKCALLHATAIDNLINQLPLSHTQTMWMPMPVFSAALIYIMLCLSGITAVTVPSTVDWSTALNSGVKGGIGMRKSSGKNADDTGLFLASDLRNPNSALGQSRSLHHRLGSLLALMGSLSVQWGVCNEMGRVLQALKSRLDSSL
ncbi:hypothetical protein BX600DRAFT_477545 [Xylariales sp. PMI_506]|nr:hypothetical protein BX600DRAFT_477545 [Xylariales sp. PMI_506]